MVGLDDELIWEAQFAPSGAPGRLRPRTLRLELRDDASSIPFVNPTAQGPLRAHVSCEPNRDVSVVFDLTVMRPAHQGFFDIAVEFDDMFCAGKVDCTGADGQPNLMPMTSSRR